MKTAINIQTLNCNTFKKQSKPEQNLVVKSKKKK